MSGSLKEKLLIQDPKVHWFSGAENRLLGLKEPDNWEIWKIQCQRWKNYIWWEDFRILQRDSKSELLFLSVKSSDYSSFLTLCETGIKKNNGVKNFQATHKHENFSSINFGDENNRWNKKYYYLLVFLNLILKLLFKIYRKKYFW